MRKQQRLIQRLLRATEIMVQGGLSETTRRCGNPNCVCRREPPQLHGPHLYVTYREDEKSRSLYVPPEHAETARLAQKAWAEFWEIGCALAKLNRDRLRDEWQREKQSRKPAGASRGFRD
jgi:Family of unknown function (DUF6788)